MTGYEYLKSIDMINEQIKMKTLEFNKLKIMSIGISSAPMDSERTKSSVNASKIADAVIRKMECENSLNDLRYLRLKRVENCKDIISKIEKEDYRDILVDRYLKGLSLYKISARKNKDYSNIKKLHKKAIEEFEKNFN